MVGAEVGEEPAQPAVAGVQLLVVADRVEVEQVVGTRERAAQLGRGPQRTVEPGGELVTLHEVEQVRGALPILHHAGGVELSRDPIDGEEGVHIGGRHGRRRVGRHRGELEVGAAVEAAAHGLQVGGQCVGGAVTVGAEQEPGGPSEVGEVVLAVAVAARVHPVRVADSSSTRTPG